MDVSGVRGSGGINPQDDNNQLALVLENLGEDRASAQLEASASGVTSATLKSLNQDMSELQAMSKSNALAKKLFNTLESQSAGGITFKEALTSTSKMTDFCKNVNEEDQQQFQQEIDKILHGQK